MTSNFQIVPILQHNVITNLIIKLGNVMCMPGATATPGAYDTLGVKRGRDSFEGEDEESIARDFVARIGSRGLWDVFQGLLNNNIIVKLQASVGHYPHAEELLAYANKLHHVLHEAEKARFSSPPRLGDMYYILRDRVVMVLRPAHGPFIGWVIEGSL